MKDLRFRLLMWIKKLFEKLFERKEKIDSIEIMDEVERREMLDE